MELSGLARNISDLERSLDSLEGWLALMTGLVVLGLVLEYWHELPEAIATLKHARSWKPLFVIAGAILITAGVAGELAIQFMASDKETALRKANDAVFADLNVEAATARKEAGDAVERAAKAEQNLGEANERAANAEKQAAKSNEIAERERLARLQLEARLAPRTLRLAQRDDLANKLKPFSGTRLDIFIYGDTSEMLSIGLTLSSVATAAGWSVKTWGVSVEMVVTGVVVGTKSGVDKEVYAAANALVLALNRNGINTSLGNVFDLPLPGRLTGPPWDNNNTAPIRMLIGSKQ